MRHTLLSTNDLCIFFYSYSAIAQKKEGNIFAKLNMKHPFFEILSIFGLEGLKLKGVHGHKNSFVFFCKVFCFYTPLSLFSFMNRSRTFSIIFF